MSKKGKHLIVNALLDLESGTAKEISSEILKTTQLKYHTTYKLLQKLRDQGVLLKQNEHYTLNPQWLNEKREFFEKLSKYEHKSLQLTQNTYQFSSVFDYIDFIKDIEKTFLERKTKTHVYKIVTHAHLFLLDPTYNMHFMQKMKKNESPISIICYGNSPIDQWAEKNLTQMGADVILGQGMGSMMVFHIYDTIALEILYSHEFRNVLREVFAEKKNMNDINLAELHTKLESTSYRIHVRAITDTEYIKDLRMRAKRVSLKAKAKKED